MDESATQSSPTITSPSPEIPVEIISDEEMALIEAAFAATRSVLSSSATSSSSLCFSSSQFRKNVRSIRSITLLSKRKISSCSTTQYGTVGDIEDAGGDSISITSTQKKNRAVTESFFFRFRRGRGLSVTDFTSTEWCEKQMELSLRYGKPEKTEAMKAGSARHAALEEEVVKKVKLEVKSKEDAWALKFVNFIVGANQLVFDGLTRELPLIGFTEDVWIVGVIDEIRMPVTEEVKVASLVDTKTRRQATLPSEPQRRNGRLQLMCYKHLWDTLVADKFNIGQFFDFFCLNPNSILSTEIRESTAKSGFPAETFSDIVRYYKNTCCMLPPASSQLLLRYEFQGDQSLIGEDQFEFDPDWLKDQMKSCLEFWMGNREARFPQQDERWKCKCCKFESVCPINTDCTQS